MFPDIPIKFCFNLESGTTMGTFPGHSVVRAFLLVALSILIFQSIASASSTPSFSVGSATDTPTGAPTVSVSPPTSYNGGAYICVAAAALNGYYGQRGSIDGNPSALDAEATAGYFTNPNLIPSQGSLYGENLTVWSWMQSTANCQASQQGDYGISTLNGEDVGPTELVAIAVNSSNPSYKFNWQGEQFCTIPGPLPTCGVVTSSSGFTYNVPKSGDLVVIAISCSAWQCESSSVPSGCTLYGTYSANWGGDWYMSVGEPTIDLYTCPSVAQGTYSVAAAPTPVFEVEDYNWCNPENYEDPQTALPTCTYGEAEESVWVFNSVSGLNTPTLTASPTLPATMDAGSNISFTTTNIGGGEAPYTLTYTISTTSGQVISHQSYSGVTSTSDNFVYQVPTGLAAGTKLEANVVVTDSASSSASSSYTPAITVNPTLRISTTSTSPAMPASININYSTFVRQSQGPSYNSVTIVQSWIGGTPPYTVTYSVTNALGSSQLVQQVQYVVSSTSNELVWRSPTPGSFNVSVKVSDSATVQSTVNTSTFGPINVLGANMIIVTSGVGDSTPYSIVSLYQSVLAKDGISSMYVELDNENATYPLGLPQVSSSSDWSEYKTLINGLEAEQGSSDQYLLLLGDANIVPMPEIAVLPQDTMMIDYETAPEPKGMGMTAAVIPTDDPYGELSSNYYVSGDANPSGTYPSIIVARMPGATWENIESMLANAYDAHQSKSNTYVGAFMTSSLYVGKTYGPFQDGQNFLVQAGLLLPGELQSATVGCPFNPSSNSTEPYPLNPEGYIGPCYQSPPYCMVYNVSTSGVVLCSPSSLSAAVISTGLEFYICHGNGWTCGDGYNKNYNDWILSSSNGDSVPVFNSSGTIAFLISCFDGEIPGTGLYSPLQSNYQIQPTAPTLSQQVLANGATTVLGLTSLGLSKVTATALSAPFRTFDQPGGESIGQAFLKSKQTLESTTNVSSEAFYDQGEEMVLYGDPTLTYNDLHSN